MSHKLAAIFGIMALLVVGELFTMRFALEVHSAVRAFVSGEGQWIRSQKNAVYFLERYARGHHEDDFKRFRESLRGPDAFRLALDESLGAKPDLDRLRRILAATDIHPDDVEVMLRHVRRFRELPHFLLAVDIWRKGDAHLAALASLGDRMHQSVLANPQPGDFEYARHRIRELNEQMSQTERDFAAELNESARWLERRVTLLVFFAVILFACAAAGLTALTIRYLSRGIRAIRDAAERVGRGDFGRPLPALSADEIGQAEKAVNNMSRMIEESQGRLEQKVQERTRELEAMAAENARLYDEARGAVQARDEFLSVASHELRNPLTALHLQLQLLERSMRSHSPGSSTPEEVLHRCQAQSRRLRALIDELLDLTRLRLGRLELHLDRCDFASLVSETTADFALEAARAGSEIHIHAPDPIVGRFDSIRVRQVVTNLLSNAIKYGEGQPIDINVERTPGGARLTVRDRGPGIPRESLSRIFERFQRLGDDSSVPGLGLGLYVSKQITETHGGTIQVWSEPMQGAAFTVELPLAPAGHPQN